MFSSVSGRFVAALKSAKNRPSCNQCSENDYDRNECTQRTSLDTILMFSSVSGRFVTALKLAKNKPGGALNAPKMATVETNGPKGPVWTQYSSFP
jgi:hypothetical protein